MIFVDMEFPLDTLIARSGSFITRPTIDGPLQFQSLDVEIDGNWIWQNSNSRQNGTTRFGQVEIPNDGKYSASIELKFLCARMRWICYECFSFGLWTLSMHELDCVCRELCARALLQITTDNKQYASYRFLFRSQYEFVITAGVSLFGESEWEHFACLCMCVWMWLCVCVWWCV